MKKRSIFIKQNKPPSIQRKIKVLLMSELKTLDSRTINNWFDEGLKYLLKHEYFERAAQLRDAKIRYDKLKKKLM